jgi:hypothetical protein
LAGRVSALSTPCCSSVSRVVSYLMIPAEKFGEAMSFLQRQRAIHRSRLRRRNPAAYRLDFLRTIQARRLALGCLTPQVYAFATEKLGLKNRSRRCWPWVRSK